MDIITNNLEIIFDVGKWVLLVLVTGFVAQFGKQFASFILTKFRKNNSEKVETFVVSTAGNGKLDKKQLKELAKIEKKKAKNLKKS